MSDPLLLVQELTFFYNPPTQRLGKSPSVCCLFIITYSSYSEFNTELFMMYDPVDNTDIRTITVNVS